MSRLIGATPRRLVVTRFSGSFWAIFAILLSLSTLSASSSQTVLVLYSDPSVEPALADFTNGLREGTEWR